MLQFQKLVLSNMVFVSLQIKENSIPAQQHPYSVSPSQPNSSSEALAPDNKVSSSILLIVVVLAIIFFASGLLHMLLRLFLRSRVQEQYDLDSVTAFQGQLQQLFHLHDSGLDQYFVETLPLFQYKTIIGLENPFDCAVCLCEFEPEDKLRLLPKCSHAFHMECIDAWLLSHSTCPLCRASLIPDYSPVHSHPPFVHPLEPGVENPEEAATSRFDRSASVNSSVVGDIELGSCKSHFSPSPSHAVVDSEGKLVPIKLGKLKNINVGEGTSNNTNADTRRCYSMGSFEYVMDENSHLKVLVTSPVRKLSTKKPYLPLMPGRLPAMSERYSESRVFNGLEGFHTSETSPSFHTVSSTPDTKASSVGDSFSISKMWLKGKRGRQSMRESASSKGAISFRLPTYADEDLKMHRQGSVARTSISDGRAETAERVSQEAINPAILVEHTQCNRVESPDRAASFARRTLLWLAGRPNKTPLGA